MLGVVQFGTLFRNYVALTDATRVGARQAAVGRSIQPESARVPNVVARVHKAAVHLDTTRITVTVEPVKLNGDRGWEQNGEVTVSATYRFEIGLLGMVAFDGTLRSRTTERVE